MAVGAVAWFDDRPATVEAGAGGELPFSGPDSLCSKVAAMGYKTTSLYEMVCAAEQSPQESE